MRIESEMSRWTRTRPLLLVALIVGLFGLVMAGFFVVPQIAAIGAFTTLILGIAAQQTLGNLFAGIMLALTKPFKVGDRVWFKPDGIEVTGVVRMIGLAYTQLYAHDMESGDMFIPNSQIIATVIEVLPANESEHHVEPPKRKQLREKAADTFAHLVRKSVVFALRD